MDSWFVIALLFWILSALACVGILIYAYVCFQYFMWDMKERELEEMTEAVKKTIDSDNSLE